MLVYTKWVEIGGGAFGLPYKAFPAILPVRFEAEDLIDLVVEHDTRHIGYVEASRGPPYRAEEPKRTKFYKDDIALNLTLVNSIEAFDYTLTFQPEKYLLPPSIRASAGHSASSVDQESIAALRATFATHRAEVLPRICRRFWRFIDYAAGQLPGGRKPVSALLYGTARTRSHKDESPFRPAGPWQLHAPRYSDDLANTVTASISKQNFRQLTPIELTASFYASLGYHQLFITARMR